MKETLKTELEDHFRPSFQPPDEIIVFHKLNHEDMVLIVDLELKNSPRMHEKGLELEIGQEAKDFLIENGTDESSGARPPAAIEHHLGMGCPKPCPRRIHRQEIVRVSVQPAAGDSESRHQDRGR